MAVELPCLGIVQRFVPEKEPHYDDSNVLDFIVRRGEDPSLYRSHAVVPINRDLATVSLKRYAKVSDPLSSSVKKLYDVAADWMEREFAPFLSNSRMRTFEEVMGWLPGDTSPGYPWTLKFTKKDMVWEDLQALEFSSEYWRRLATDDPIRSFCSVSVKEEVRPIYKVQNKKVRTIVAMDINHVVSHAIMCLSQNEALHLTHNKHPIKIGIPLQYGGFHNLNDYMDEFGVRTGLPCTIELDGVQFDAVYHSYAFDHVRDFRFRMLPVKDRTPENYNRMCNLYSDLTYAPLVNVDGVVYGRSVGNPSGQECTTPDNSLKNYMDIATLYLLSVPPELGNYECWKRLVRLCICGDDVNISVDPLIHHLFNVDSILKHASSIGMEYTIPFHGFRRNYECTFLGHGFIYSRIPGYPFGMYLPKADCDKMKSSALIYNREQTNAMSIVRACGLRNETFTCGECRSWFAALIESLRVRFPIGSSLDTDLAWKNYKTDVELWSLYTGREPVVGHIH